MTKNNIKNNSLKVRVQTKFGGKIEGEFIEEDKDFLVLRTKEGRTSIRKTIIGIRVDLDPDYVADNSTEKSEEDNNIQYEDEY